MKPIPIALVASLAISSVGHAAELKTYLMMALNNPAIPVSGVVSGNIADSFRATTRSAAPVVADIGIVRRFQQEGCARLAVRLSQTAVPTTEGKVAPFAIRYELNLCRDGSPPAEGMDLSAVSRILAPQPVLPK